MFTTERPSTLFVRHKPVAKLPAGQYVSPYKALLLERVAEHLGRPLEPEEAVDLLQASVQRRIGL